MIDLVTFRNVISPYNNKILERCSSRGYINLGKDKAVSALFTDIYTASKNILYSIHDFKNLPSELLCFLASVFCIKASKIDGCEKDVLANVILAISDIQGEHGAYTVKLISQRLPRYTKYYKIGEKETASSLAQILNDEKDFIALRSMSAYFQGILAENTSWYVFSKENYLKKLESPFHLYLVALSSWISSSGVFSKDLLKKPHPVNVLADEPQSKTKNNDFDTVLFPTPKIDRYIQEKNSCGLFYEDFYDTCYETLNQYITCDELELKLHGFVFVYCMLTITDLELDTEPFSSQITEVIAEKYPLNKANSILDAIADAFNEYRGVYCGETEVHYSWMENVPLPQKMINDLLENPYSRVTVYFWSELLMLVSKSHSTNALRRINTKKVMDLYGLFIRDFYVWTDALENLCSLIYDDEYEEEAEEDMDEQKSLSGERYGELFGALYLCISEALAEMEIMGEAKTETLAFLYFMFDCMAFNAGKDRDQLWKEISNCVECLFPDDNHTALYEKMHDRAMLYAHITNKQIKPNNGYYPPIDEDNRHFFKYAWFAYGGILKDPASADYLLKPSAPLWFRPINETLEFSVLWTSIFQVVIEGVHDSGLFYND